MDELLKSVDKLDIIVFVAYFFLVLGIAFWVSRKPKGHERNTEDYFLAGRSLPWWIIGTSLIASNISAEQMIGMSGKTFASGIAVVSYEWMSAITLIIIAIFFLPIFLRMRIYSMPDFLARRFHPLVASILGVFWVCLYIFVNLATVMMLGAKAMSTILPGLEFSHMIIFLAVLSAVYTVYGGLSAVAWTDVIQVVVLFLGGIILSLVGLDKIGAMNGSSTDSNIVTGFGYMMADAKEHFHTVLPWNHETLPWIGVFIGGMWVANFSYWGFNQYITQRALAGKDLKQAQRGLLFAGFLKVIIPFVVVLPGVIAFSLFKHDMNFRQPMMENRKVESTAADGTPHYVQTNPDAPFAIELEKSEAVADAQFIDYDKSYPALINYLAHKGLKGLMIAAILAAIISSLNSMINSASTIFTMDIYRKWFAKTAPESKLVFVGRVFTGIGLVVGAFMAWKMQNLQGAFDFIQKYTGMVSPGICALFIFGIFYKRANAMSALVMAVASIPVCLLLSILPDIVGKTTLIGQFMTPFLNWMGVAFLIICFIGWVTVLATSSSKNEFCTSRFAHVTAGSPEDAHVGSKDPIFWLGSAFVVVLLMVLYIRFW